MTTTALPTTGRTRLGYLLRDLPIRHKLQVTIIGIMGSALFVAFMLMAMQGHRSLMERETTHLSSLLGVVAANSAGALLFADRQDAAATLAALAGDARIRAVVLFHEDGRELARYPAGSVWRPLPQDRWHEGVRLHQDRFDGIRAVTLKDQRVGWVAASAGLEEFHSVLWRQISFLGWVFVTAFVLMLLMVHLLQHQISAPIRRLTGFVTEVSRSNDYSRRMASDSEDEIGQLTRGINRMLHIINLRDRALAQHRVQLEERVQERTRELEREKVRAEAANRAKSAFLANMSHELRTPLNAVLGYAQVLLRDAALGAAQLRHVKSILRGGDYLLVLINDILDLAKIEAGRFELTPGPCALPRFFSDLAEVFELRARQKGITLQSRIAAALPETVEADERRLRQVCMNLLGNAIKFTEQGTVTLEATYADGWLRITVSDTGIGIPPERISALFQPFVQAGDDAYKQQGTGLGLAISRSLAQEMGGAIEASSDVGTGSRFTVRLPVPTLDEKPAPSISASATVVGYERTDGLRQPLRLLVVDDNETNRRVLRDLLEPLGFAVERAIEGRDALEKVALRRPDLVLMDLVMPGMNGLEATAAIHAIPGLEQLPVIAVSARTFPEDRAESLAAGCVEHLGKPVDTPALHGLLQRHLPLTWRVASGEAKTAPAPGSAIPAPSCLPEGSLDALKTAVTLGNSQQIRDALAVIEASDAEFAAILGGWIAGYEYDRILSLSSPCLQEP